MTSKKKHPVSQVGIALKPYFINIFQFKLFVPVEPQTVALNHGWEYWNMVTVTPLGGGAEPAAPKEGEVMRR